MRTQTFSDFDDFAESIRGVVSKMMLRNATEHRWKLRTVDLQGIGVQIGELGSGNIAHGDFRGNGLLLYLPLTSGVEYSANGTVLERGSFAVLQPGCEFFISTKVSHDWCAVTLPMSLLIQQGLSVLPATGPTLHVTSADQQAAIRFRQIVTQVMSLAAKTNQIESGETAASVSEALLEVAAAVVPLPKACPDNHGGRPKVPREQIIACTLEHLQQHEDDVVHIGDLAEAADVSERTLRNAFNDYFGVSPTRYVQFRQLHQVHRALRAARAHETTVSHVLLAHGAWEFSRFAARYRRLFGELPSETLRKKL